MKACLVGLGAALEIVEILALALVEVALTLVEDGVEDVLVERLDASSQVE